MNTSMHAHRRTWILAYMLICFLNSNKSYADYARTCIRTYPLSLTHTKKHRAIQMCSAYKHVRLLFLCWLLLLRFQNNWDRPNGFRRFLVRMYVCMYVCLLSWNGWNPFGVSIILGIAVCLLLLWRNTCETVSLFIHFMHMCVCMVCMVCMYVSRTWNVDCWAWLKANVHVCMYVCVYVCMYVCIYVRMH
jgi:hypothetical protein